MLRTSHSIVWALLVTALAAALWACQRPEEVLTNSPEVKLRFSSDTVLFDTLLTTVGSITKRLTVYNPSRNAVEISSVRLQGGAQSPYRLVVNGQQGQSAEGLRLLGGDSLLVLVSFKSGEVNAERPFVLPDVLEFTTNGNRQQVRLLAWGQDANFLNGGVLTGANVWRGRKPYVILGNLLVDTLSSLRIEPGVNVYLASQASLFVKGSLRIQGTPQQPVNFGGTRLDRAYRDVPGQWGAIFFLEGSQQNLVSSARIRCGSIGLRIGTPDTDTLPDVVVENSVIEHMSSAGIAAFNSDVEVVNTQINNCVDRLVAGLAGGHYRLRHCTLANTGTRFFRDKASMLFATSLPLENGTVLSFPLWLRLENSIVWGDQTNEIELLSDSRNTVAAQVRNSVLKTNDARLNGNANLPNRNPMFVRTAEYNFRLDSLSPAVNLGAPLGIATDLLGRPRGRQPDAGAYERRD